MRSGPAGDVRCRPRDGRHGPRVGAPGRRRGPRRAPDHGLHHGDRPRHARGGVADPGSEPARRRVAAQGRTRRGLARRPRLRDPRRREAAGARGAAAPRGRGAGARARGRDARRRPPVDPRSHRGADRVSVVEWMAYTAGAAGLWAVWYLVGSGAGVLWTRRGLWVGAALAGWVLLGLLGPSALPAPLLPDLGALALGWVVPAAA